MVIWVSGSGPLVLILSSPCLPFLTCFTVHPHRCPHNQEPHVVCSFHFSTHHWHCTVPALVPSHTHQPLTANSTQPALSNAPPLKLPPSGPHCVSFSISQWQLTVPSPSPSPRDIATTSHCWQHRLPQNTLTTPTHKSPPQYVLANFLSTTNAMWS